MPDRLMPTTIRQLNDTKLALSLKLVDFNYWFLCGSAILKRNTIAFGMSNPGYHVQPWVSSIMFHNNSKPQSSLSIPLGNRSRETTLSGFRLDQAHEAIDRQSRCLHPSDKLHPHICVIVIDVQSVMLFYEHLRC